MTIKNYDNRKLITLSNAFENRAKILNIFYFLVFTSGCIVLLKTYASAENKPIGLLIFTLIVVYFYLYAGYKFINKALQTEKLIVRKHSITISKKGFLFNKHHTYDINKMVNL
jgi:hypothetical protein